MKDLVCRVRDQAIKKGVTFCDVRAVWRQGTSIQRQDGRSDKMNGWSGQGVGVRVLHEGAWGFASCDGFDLANALESLDRAATMAHLASKSARENMAWQEVSPVVEDVVETCRIDPASVSPEKKMEVLARYEKEALDAAGSQLVNSIITYSDGRNKECLANTAGTLLSQEWVASRIGSVFTASDGLILQRGSEHHSARKGFEILEDISPRDLSVKAAQRAVSLLSAKPAPPGPFAVVLHPSVVGVFIHEALGHNAEADLVLAGESILEGKVGQTIGSHFLTVYDDATLPGSWGSYPYDSEGTRSQKKLLVEKGVLKGFMHNLETASRFGVPPNGSGRADGAGSRPIVRMSNTIIEKGDSTLEELLKPIDHGILLEGGQWGYVMCEKGQFTCHAGHAHAIRHGETCELLRDVSVSGTLLDALKLIDGATEYFEMLTFGGTCGKSGQGAPVNGGGPYLRIKSLVVGGMSEGE